MTDVLLIRHGLCDPVGQLIAGRSPGVHLNATGRRQARTLADMLEHAPLVAVYSSPVDRALETAAALAGRIGLKVRISPGLEELDYGAWTGRTLESLSDDPVWRRFNVRRGATRIPDGESMAEVVARAGRALAGMQREHEDGLVAAVTHGDVIRALLAHYLGMRLDHMLRLEVAPASVSVIRFAPEPRVMGVNWLPDPASVL